MTSHGDISDSRVLPLVERLTHPEDYKPFQMLAQDRS